MKTIEQSSSHAQALQAAKEEMPDAPEVKLHGWHYYSGVTMGWPCLCAKGVENHPRLGTHFSDDPFNIQTSRVKYISKEMGIAITMNTIYILVGPEQ